MLGIHLKQARQSLPSLSLEGEEDDQSQKKVTEDVTGEVHGTGGDLRNEARLMLADV